MSDHRDVEQEAAAEQPSPAKDEGGTAGTAAATADEPDWWHRDHPTFTALAGFFTGLVSIIVVPGVYAAVLSALFETDTARDLFPFVLVLLAVPLVLMTAQRTRRFGRYLLLGMVLTALVVSGVAALVLWYMVEFQS